MSSSDNPAELPPSGQMHSQHPDEAGDAHPISWVPTPPSVPDGEDGSSLDSIPQQPVESTPQESPGTPAPPAVVESPCIRLCVLSLDGVCMGCYRTSDEIGRWGKASAAEKQQILSAVRQRRFTSTLAKGRQSR